MEWRSGEENEEENGGRLLGIRKMKQRRRQEENETFSVCVCLLEYVAVFYWTVIGVWCLVFEVFREE